MTELQPTTEAEKDMALVDRFKCGDRAAFDALFHRHKDSVYSLVCRTVGPDLADDTTQEAFTQIHRSLPKFRGDSKLKTWMCCVTMNVCRAAIRRRGRQPELISSDVPGYSEEACYRADDLVDSWKREELKRAIMALSDTERVSIELHYIQGLSYAEMALALKSPAGTIKARVHNAITTLRAKLKHLEDEVDGL